MAKSIDAGSHSRLKVFGSCKAHAKYKFVDKIPEPDRGEPAVHKISKLREHANDRGSRLHSNAEAFIKGKVLLNHELHHFAQEYSIAKHLYAKGLATTEQRWYFDENWVPFTPKHEGDKRIYFRALLDLVAHFSKTHALVVDLKTGALFGKELEYSQQTLDYACLTLLKFPQLERIDTELWFPDSNDLKRMTFTRAQAARALRGLNMRMQDMTKERRFPATPNYYSCRYCPYSPKHNGPCKVGVQ